MIDPVTRIDDKTGLYIEPPGLGLSWFWMLPASHPFHWCGVKHDLRYDLRVCGMLSDKSSELSDKKFLRDCESVAILRSGSDRAILDVEANIFYEIVKIVGKERWPSPSIDPGVIALHMNEAISKIQWLRVNGYTYEGTSGDSI